MSYMKNTQDKINALIDIYEGKNIPPYLKSVGYLDIINSLELKSINCSLLILYIKKIKILIDIKTIN